MAEPIRKQVDLKASPRRVYDALLDASQFSTLTGAPAEIDRIAGGAFSCFGGIITGRHVELVPDRQIVQAWRVKAWPEGAYSIVTFELHPRDGGTRLTLTHDAFPDGMRPHLNGDMPQGGWDRQYLEPLRRYLD
jgi:activator of HSP90 ATPase